MTGTQQCKKCFVIYSSTVHLCDNVVSVEDSDNANFEILLNNVLTQHYGLTHHWAGQWSKCKECTQLFAFGWNWSDDDNAPDKCPLCKLTAYKTFHPTVGY
jgi:rubrerythrin